MNIYGVKKKIIAINHLIRKIKALISEKNRSKLLFKLEKLEERKRKLKIVLKSLYLNKKRLKK